MAPLITRKQVSAGGVVFREREVALISVEGKPGEGGRWQLPKGLVRGNERPEETAAREVREETGLKGELVAPLETIEYWYVAKRQGVRFHKFVHFYLFRYLFGSLEDHDHEVLVARWVGIDEAESLLTFASERKVLAKARELLRDSEGSAP